MRTAVNPILMQPRTVKSYIPLIDSIATEFIEKIPSLQDDKKEMPDNFSEYLNRWTLESIVAIALEKRLGLLDFNQLDPRAEKLMKTVRKIFVLGAEFEFKPTVWRWYETKAFKELLGVYDDLTKLVGRIYFDSSSSEFSLQLIHGVY